MLTTQNRSLSHLLLRDSEPHAHLIFWKIGVLKYQSEFGKIFSLAVRYQLLNQLSTDSGLTKGAQDDSPGSAQYLGSGLHTHILVENFCHVDYVADVGPDFLSRQESRPQAYTVIFNPTHAASTEGGTDISQQTTRRRKSKRDILLGATLYDSEGMDTSRADTQAWTSPEGEDNEKDILDDVWDTIIRGREIMDRVNTTQQRLHVSFC